MAKTQREKLKNGQLSSILIQWPHEMYQSVRKSANRDDVTVAVWLREIIKEGYADKFDPHVQSKVYGPYISYNLILSNDLNRSLQEMVTNCNLSKCDFMRRLVSYNL